MWRSMSARFNAVSSLAHRARVFAPAAVEGSATPTAAESPAIEPDVTRDLFERAARLVETGCFDKDDADAILHVLERADDAEAPSFF